MLLNLLLIRSGVEAVLEYRQDKVAQPWAQYLVFLLVLGFALKRACCLVQRLFDMLCRQLTDGTPVVDLFLKM